MSGQTQEQAQPRRFWPGVREVLLIEATCIVAAIIYGIAHDMVTAHVCIEYFTVGHFDVFAPQQAPAWRYALYWGVAATWWVGAWLGLLLILFARVSKRVPRATARQIAPKLLAVLFVQWVAAMLVLWSAYENLGAGFRAHNAISSDVPVDAHRGFMADWITHLFSYGAALPSTIILGVWIISSRIRAQKQAPASQ